MTALAIDIRRERLAVGSDTAGYLIADEIAPLYYVSKVLAMPYLRAVLFGCGITAIGYKAAFDLMVSPQLLTIEAAAEALPDMLHRITEQYAAEMGIN